MLGIADFWVFLAYTLCLFSAALCLVYGIATWRKGAEPVKKEDLDWLMEEAEESNEV